MFLMAESDAAGSLFDIVDKDKKAFRRLAPARTRPWHRCEAAKGVVNFPYVGLFFGFEKTRSLMLT
jgi:hypothetical protein